MEIQHTSDTANRKIVPLPSIMEMEPKKARRAWAIFLADNDMTADSEPWRCAERVRLAINSWVMNEGRAEEPSARQRVEQDLAAFSQVWSQRNG